jgi:pyruvate kinase
VVLDLQGSKWRLGETARRAVSAGEVVELVLGGNNDRDGAAPSAAAAGEMPTIPVPHPDFFEACRASSGTKVLVNDARVELRIEAAHERWVRARVTRGGEVSAGKGVTIPASPLRREALSSKDQSIVRLDSSVPEAGFAVSYLRDAREARAYRRQVGDDAYLIGKLERPTAVSERAAIAETVDELWLCRGDLAAEMGLAGMARAVAAVTAEAMSLPVPLLMAGQVFEHMSGAPEPTRAEVVQLYDVLAAGYAGVVLSDETATGLWPEAAVRTAALFQEHAGG